MNDSTKFQNGSPWYGGVLPSSVGRPITVYQILGTDFFQKSQQISQDLHLVFSNLRFAFGDPHVALLTDAAVYIVYLAGNDWVQQHYLNCKVYDGVLCDPEISRSR